jgi:hypothetical protein
MRFCVIADEKCLSAAEVGFLVSEIATEVRALAHEASLHSASQETKKGSQKQKLPV